MHNRFSLVKYISYFTASLIVVATASWAQGLSVPIFKRQAGSWQINITLEKLEGVGVPEGTKEKMQILFDKQSEQRLCLTQSAAAKEDFVGNMMNSAKNNNCSNVTENVTAETMNIVAKCAGPDGKEFTIAMQGDYSPTITNMIMKSENAPTPNGPITMHMRTSSKWVGECSPGQQEIYSPE